MKKLAWMFAALSICACSFTACGGDDDDTPECTKTCNAETETLNTDTCSCDPKTQEPECTAENAAEKCTDPTKPVCKDGVCSAAESTCTKTEADCNAETETWNADTCSCDPKQAECTKTEADCNAETETWNADTCSCDPKQAEDKANEGEDCTSKKCADNLTCDDTSKKCVKAQSDNKKDIGEECTKDEECASNVCSEVCISADEDCTNFEPSCSNTADGAIAYTACSTETGITAVKCYENTDGKTDCKAGACVAPETEDIECNDTIACTDPGKVCKDNKCVDDTSTNECNESNKKCSEGKTCLAGKCIDTPVEDTDCDESKFERACDGVRNIYVCIDKKVTKASCNEALDVENGGYCMTASDKSAHCVIECRNEDNLKAGDKLAGGCDNNTAYNFVCAADYYGEGLWAFEADEDCGSKTCSKETGKLAVCK